MTRSEIREFEAVLLAAGRLRTQGDSTLVATALFGEIMMEHLHLADVELLRDYPAEQRRRMAKDGRAMPDGSFPIGNCADAANAIRAQGRAKPGKRGAVKAHIRKRVRALGCKGPIFDDYK